MISLKNYSSRKVLYGLTSFIMICTSLVTPTVTTYAADSTFTANAMAPLKVTNMDQFKSDLKIAKEMGIDAISVDVWWGDVEGSADNVFEWSYYDKVFSAIKEADLEMLPIMSFHQCGGNVGDDYTSRLPEWIWTKYQKEKVEGQNLTKNNLRYKSSQGNYSNEYIALWADEVVSNEYIDFMDAFEKHYGKLYPKDIEEINISGGPSGELRYPSYNSHDYKTDYPNKGAFQCYSDLAQADFRNAMLKKYLSLDKLNEAWGTSLTSLSQVTPPMNGDNFFSSGGGHPYYETQYGKDFLEWYNTSLIEHGKNMLTYAEEAFDEEFEGIKLGMKIPGVHWQMESETPRAAEVASGIINSDFSETNGYGYNPILKMIKSFGGKVILHFTCLEMNDYSGNKTSTPKKLVGYVGDSARKLGVEVKGENALSGGIDQVYFWNNIREAISRHGYNGITILRLRNVVTGNAYNSYKALIADHKSKIPSEKVKVRFSVDKANTLWGQNVYIVGSIEELGNWKPALAVKLNPSGYPTWSKEIEVPSGTEFEFKFIKKDQEGNVIWESGSNRSFKVKTADSSYAGTWR